MAPSEVLIKHPFPSGLPDTWTVAQTPSRSQTGSVEVCAASQCGAPPSSLDLVGSGT